MLNLISILIVIVVVICSRRIDSLIPSEGCAEGEQPPKWNYDNPWVNYTINEIPDWAIKQMSSLYHDVIGIMDRDYLGVTTEYGSWVFYGAAGRAYLHLLLLNENKTFHLNMAEVYITEALGSLPEDLDHFAYLKGNVGIFTVASMVFFLKGEVDISHFYLTKVKETFKNVTSENDSDYDEGIGGLIDLAPILNNFFDSEAISSEDELRIGHLIFQNGLNHYNQSTKALQFKNWHGKATEWWIGVGVGSAGSIFQLMKRPELMSNSTIRRYVKSTMEYFLTQQSRNGDVRSDYPSRVQWCHGSPGFIPVFIQAHIVFGDDKYLEAAKLAGEYTAINGILMKGYSLGHGVAGNVYMVMELYKYTKDEYWLSKALSMLLVSLKTPALVNPLSWKSWDCVPGSFWVSSQGGMVSLFHDIVVNQNNLMDIEMPIFGSFKK